MHPESEYVADDVNVQMDIYGPHSRFIAPMYIPSPRRIDEDKALNEIMTDYLKSEGFPVDSFEGDVTTLRSAVAAHKRAMTSEHGLDFSNLTTTSSPTSPLICSVSRCGCFATDRTRLIRTKCISTE